MDKKPYELHLGKCTDAIRAMPDNSVDSIVTDPPYGLRFMGKCWDYDVPGVEIWAECLRVLKPGGHLLAFSGTRTQHRMAVRIEDAGFEIRDMIAWVYGSGFPKSMDVSKAILKSANCPICLHPWELHGLHGCACVTGKHPDGEHFEGGKYYCHCQCLPSDSQHWQGWGTALKPALEPITVARKPLAGTVAANVLAHGTGALNIDGCRVGNEQITQHGRGDSSNVAMAGRNYAEAAGRAWTGRWPANLIHDGSHEVVALFPAQAGASAPVKGTECSAPAKNAYGEYGRVQGAFHADSGSAARFFYCAKTSRKDRNEGLPTGDHKAVSTDATMRQIEDADWSARNGNHHPTVKPTDLMAYLCRLVTPPGGVVLDPFMGSGSTGKAAMREGFQFIGCEIDDSYMKIAVTRIENEFKKIRDTQQSLPI